MCTLRPIVQNKTRDPQFRMLELRITDKKFNLLNNKPLTGLHTIAGYTHQVNACRQSRRRRIGIIITAERESIYALAQEVHKFYLIVLDSLRQLNRERFLRRVGEYGKRIGCDQFFRGFLLSKTAVGANRSGFIEYSVLCSRATARYR